MKNDIHLIAFDLDETLLNTDKTLSAENKRALMRAVDAGMLIVPATGRIFCGIPECVRELPLRYAIIANGAEVTDLETGACLYSAWLENARAVALMQYLDPLPVAYDCYMGGKAYMAKQFLDSIETYIATPAYVALARWLRTPVPYLPDFIKDAGLPLQKVQLFTTDAAFKAELKTRLERDFPDLFVTCATPENIEINAKAANKGDALLSLCARLGIKPEQSMAFGDGLNDIPMIRAAGIGIAMQNAAGPVLAAADYVTLSNNEAGVAAAIDRFCF